jgi:hypothetical protein
VQVKIEGVEAHIETVVEATVARALDARAGDLWLTSEEAAASGGAR